MLSSNLRRGLPKGLFLLHLRAKTLYAFLKSSMRATCPVHLSRLDLRFLFMLGEEYNSHSSAFCNFLHSLSPKYLPKHFALEHPYPALLSQGERPSFTTLRYNW